MRKLYFYLLFVIFSFFPILVHAYTYENVGYQNNNSEVYALTNYLSSPVNLPRADNSKYFTGGNSEYLNGLLILTDQLNLDSSYVYQFEVSTPGTTLSLANTADVVYGTANNTTGSCNVLSVLYTNEYPQITFKCNTGGVNITELSVTYRNTSNTAIITGGTNLWWNYVFMRRQIDDSSSNTQDIINNQNQNAQDIQNTINDNLQTCRNSLNLANPSDFTLVNATLNNGIYSASDNDNANSLVMKIQQWSSLSSYLNVSGSQLTKNVSSTGRISFTSTILSGANYIRIGNAGISNEFRVMIPIPSSFSVGDKFTISFDITDITIGSVKLKDIQLEKGTIMTDYIPYGVDLCTNKIDDVTDSVNGLNDTLKDDSPVDVSSLGNTVGWLPSGPIDSIINLPLNFFNSISSSLSGTCHALNITIPFINTNISIPCLSTIFGQINGLTTFWNWVGRIASVYILYKYLLALWDYYDRLTTLQVNFRDDFGGGV